MGLNMRGHVSGPFITHKGVVLNRYSSEIVDFEPVLAITYTDAFDANVQPVSDKEIEFLNMGRSPQRRQGNRGLYPWQAGRYPGVRRDARQAGHLVEIHRHRLPALAQLLPRRGGKARP